MSVETIKMDDYWDKKLKELIPADDLKRCLQSPFSELEGDFLCFADVYGWLSEIIPKDKVIVDLGCNQALQGYFYSEHKGYIGIDVTLMESRCPKPEHDYLWYVKNHEPIPDYFDFGKNHHIYRANCPNSTYIVSDIKKYLQSKNTEESNWLKENCFAIMSYVPDREAWDMAEQFFPNIAGYYGGGYYGRDIIRLNGKTYDFAPYDKAYMQNLIKELNDKEEEMER